MFEININPVAFTIGSIEVRWYGILVALAILAIVLWMAWQVKKGARISYDTVFTVALVGIPSGIVLSRLLHVIDFREYYIQNPGQIIGGSGLTIYGAVLGAALGIWIYSKFSKLQFGYFADMVAPGIILAQIIGRIGCIINGCCYGVHTSSSPGVIYSHPACLAPLGEAVHFTQLYEIIFLAIVFGIVIALKGRLKPDGSQFLVYLGLYSLWRLGIDFLREGTDFIFGLHQAQVIGLIVLAIAIFLLASKVRWVRVKDETDEE